MSTVKIETKQLELTADKLNAAMRDLAKSLAKAWQPLIDEMLQLLREHPDLCSGELNVINEANE
tara:strand:- start:42 stop:233 length:192 start_codon:yes stop_codon:yes gene_type:complete